MTDQDPAASPPSDNTTLGAVLADYEQAGYSGQMTLGDDAVECLRCGHASGPEQLELHSLRRLEGASDPADMAAVLAVACPACGERATMVVRFGPESSPAEAALLRRMRDRRVESEIPGGAAPTEGRSGN